MHKVDYNSKTIWDRDKVKIETHSTMFIDDVYWFWHFNDEYFRGLREHKFTLKFQTKMVYRFQNWSPNSMDIIYIKFNHFSIRFQKDFDFRKF